MFFVVDNSLASETVYSWEKHFAKMQQSTNNIIYGEVYSTVQKMQQITLPVDDTNMLLVSLSLFNYVNDLPKEIILAYVLFGLV